MKKSLTPTQCPTCAALTLYSYIGNRIWKGIWIRDAVWRECDSCKENIVTATELKRWQKIRKETDENTRIIHKS